MLASVKAVLAKLGAIWTADDTRDHSPAAFAFISRTQQLTGIQDELVEGGDVILRRAIRDRSIFARFFFVVQFGDLLHELEQRRLSFRSLYYDFQRCLVTSELLAGVAAMDLLSWRVVAFCYTEEPAFFAASFTWRRFITAA